MISSIGSISSASIGVQALNSLRAPNGSTEIKPVAKVIRRERPEDPFATEAQPEDEDREQLLRDLGRSTARPTIVETGKVAEASEVVATTSETGSADASAAAGPDQKSATGEQLLPEEKQQVDDLKQRDREVRRHEAAHKAAAGQNATGGATFSYQTGPDGRRYAVGGEVSIDTSAVEGDPQATIAKMQQIQRAAQAPAEPSSQDRQVAAQASQAEAKARAELSEQRRTEQSGQGEAEAKSGGPSSTLSVNRASPFAAIFQQSQVDVFGKQASGRSLNLVA